MIVILRLSPTWARGAAAAVQYLPPANRSKLVPRYGLVRALGVAAAVLALCATTIADAPLSQPIGVPQLRLDPRIARLEMFFRTYNCPKPHHVFEYLRVADDYGLDYRLLPAVSIRETTCGLTEIQNNRWGYHPGRQSFPSVPAGIDFVARQLAKNAPYKGKTLQEKLFTYNPRATYPVEVQKIMRQIE